jgi:hypothetical protein
MGREERLHVRCSAARSLAIPRGGNLTLENLDGTRLREEMDKNEREKLESCRETADG